MSFVYPEELFDKDIAAEGIPGILPGEKNQMIEVISKEQIKNAINKIASKMSPYIHPPKTDMCWAIALEEELKI